MNATNYKQIENIKTKIKIKIKMIKKLMDQKGPVTLLEEDAINVINHQKKIVGINLDKLVF